MRYLSSFVAIAAAACAGCAAAPAAVDLSGVDRTVRPATVRAEAEAPAPPPLALGPGTVDSAAVLDLVPPATPRHEPISIEPPEAPEIVVSGGFYVTVPWTDAGCIPACAPCPRPVIWIAPPCGGGPWARARGW
jgi:hypothetical protein